MKRHIVESSTLLTIAYDLDRQILQLEFRDHATYNYFDVPADVYQALLDAPSIGGYFNRYIRAAFKYVRIKAAFLS